MTREQLRRATTEIVATLPEGANWEDLMYSVYARQRIEEGLADSNADRVASLDEVRSDFA